MRKTGMMMVLALLPAALALQGCNQAAEQPSETVAAEEQASPVLHKVLITAQVEDAAAWEAAFRSHGELFRAQHGTSPILLGTTDDNFVAVLEQTADLDAYMADLQSETTTEAMKGDGVKADTVKVVVLDREFAY